jgi:phosphotransferase system HPr (HPr) family protein
MDEPSAKRVATIRSPRGLHMRPWGEFAQLAARYDAKIEVINGSVRADGRSLVQLMTLAAGQGAQVVLEGAGPQCQEALDALAEYLENLFEDTCND